MSVRAGGSFAGVVVEDADDRRVGNLRMREEQTLELGGRNVITLDLDQLLQPIGDLQEATVVDGSDILGPSGDEGGRRGEIRPQVRASGRFDARFSG